jgi:putative addiction module killer protein
MLQLVDYLTEAGRDPLKDWLANLSDRQARARVLVRLQRMSAGNFGDCKPISDGVWELRIDYAVARRRKQTKTVCGHRYRHRILERLAEEK